MTYIAPDNQFHVIAGQGTCTKELIEEVGELDFLFVAIGGGGLIAGCSLAAKALSPKCRVIGVESQASNNVALSLAAGQPVSLEESPKTIADGAAARHTGDVSFEIIKDNVEQVVLVTDEELLEEMKFAGERLKLIVEPAGVLGLAGLRKFANSGEMPDGSRVGVIVCGGNIDMMKYCKYITEGIS